MFSAGDDHEHLGLLAARVLLELAEQLAGRPTVSFATTSSRFSPGGCGGAACFTGSSSAPRDISHQATIAPVSSRKTTSPNHLLITYATAISPK